MNTRLMRDSGWTGPSLEAAQSAALLMSRIESLEPAMHGRLVTCEGTIIPW